MFFPLEALHTDRAYERSVGIVSELVTLEMLLPLESRTAYIADEPPLDLVTDQMLLEQFFLRISHVALRTAEECRAVEGRDDADLTGFRLLRLRWLLLVLLLALRFRAGFLFLWHVRYYLGLAAGYRYVDGLLAGTGATGRVEAVGTERTRLYRRLPLYRLGGKFEKMMKTQRQRAGR